MTYDREHLDADEWKSMYEAAVENFLKKEISEEEFRKKLAKLGFNAREIDAEVEGYTK